MSTYDTKMDTNEVDDAESAYFQEVHLLEDNTDQSSGSFQGSLAIPSFSMNSSSAGGIGVCREMEQSRGRVQLSSLALQGSQGFQTLDQSAIGAQWQTVGWDNEIVTHGLSVDPTIAVDVLTCNTGVTDNQKTTLASIDLQEVRDTDNFLLVNTLPSDFLTGEHYTVITSEANKIKVNNSALAHGATSNVNELVYSQMETVTESSSQESRSPKRRQKKSRSSSHQGSEIQSQKSDSGRPSVSPTRGEYGSGDGQGGSELSFKPSLLEEILTEKKLALMRSPEVMHFLQSQQEQRKCTGKKTAGEGQNTDNS